MYRVMWSRYKAGHLGAVNEKIPRLEATCIYPGSRSRINKR
jgi:hypothetical protein